MRLIKLILFIALTSCGTQKIEVSDSEQRVDGEVNVNVNINWNLEQLEQFIADQCAEDFDLDQNIQECIDAELEELYTLLDSVADQLQEAI